MKKFYTFSFLFMSLMAVVLMSNSAGRATVAGEDTTGSPLGNRTCGTAGCHSSNSFTVNMVVELKDEDGAVVDKYKPGVTYDVQLTNNASGSPASYGFQMVSLVDADNSGANEWETTTNKAKTVDLGDVTYVEQTGPDPSNTVDLKWTAPAAGTGDVTFYAVGNAINGNGNTNGDGVGTTTLSLTEDMTSSTNDVNINNISIMPNPASDVVRLSMDNISSGTYQLINLQGQSVLRGVYNADNIELNVAALKTGLYVVQVQDQVTGAVMTSKLIKE